MTGISREKKGTHLQHTVNNWGVTGAAGLLIYMMIEATGTGTGAAGRRSDGAQLGTSAVQPEQKRSGQERNHRPGIRESPEAM